MTRYVTANQLAERYKVHKATIWRWVNRDILPQPIKLSEQCTRFDFDEVERREAARTRQGSASG
jgi:predicted DNA-binding transcriptional regulator AlpA